MKIGTPENVARPRLVGLDLIRGICALGVMVYHYWYASGFGYINGMGTYGVYIFFALSGFALFYVYSTKEISEKFLCEFYISRCLRIFPLFLAVAIYRSWGDEATAYNVARFIVNVTPLAGIAHTPNFSPLIIGGWSVLIEWSFYLLFPFLLLFRGLKNLIALFIFTAAIGWLHGLAAMYPPEGLRGDRLFSFTDTLTFLCYFVGGMLGAHIFMHHPNLTAWVRPGHFPLGFAVSLLILIFFWDQVFAYAGRRTLLSGETAVFLMLLGCVVVFLAAHQEPQGVLKKISVFLGDISFALYLTHMYVWQLVVGLLDGRGGAALQIGVSSLLTISFAAVVYQYFERPIRDIRKDRWGSVPTRGA